MSVDIQDSEGQMVCSTSSGLVRCWLIWTSLVGKWRQSNGQRTEAEHSLISSRANDFPARFYWATKAAIVALEVTAVALRLYQNAMQPNRANLSPVIHVADNLQSPIRKRREMPVFRKN